MTPKPDIEPVATLVERLTARAKSEQEGGSEAAAERAMMGMEAKSDLWAERVNLNDLIGNIVNVGRLDRSAPDAVREKFIKRQFELIDALMRQAFLEGYLEGGLSRKAYDDELDTATASALLALEGERDALRETNAVLDPAGESFHRRMVAAEAEVARLRSDKARLDWLETMVVNVRSKLVYGSADVFWASPDDSFEGELGPSDIRKQIDTEMQLRALSSSEHT
jgi:hypothetical protein